jgi:hypothetical protein
MAGEGQLAGEGEDTHPIAGVVGARVEEECRLGESQPSGQLEHLLCRQALGIDHDR